MTHLASKNTATHQDDLDIPIQFLFRKQGKTPRADYVAATPLPWHQRIFRGKNQRIQSTQWTARLAALADEHRPDLAKEHPHDIDMDVEKSTATFDPEEIKIPVALRLEGPYFSPADPFRYNTVICLVAGTGISGAIAIAAAFNHAATNDNNETTTPPRKWRRCIIIWSVKESDDIDLPFLEPKAQGLELRRCLTGAGRDRVDLTQALSEICLKVKGETGRSWVYTSGPNRYIESAKEACKRVKQQTELDFYAASWDI